MLAEPDRVRLAPVARLDPLPYDHKTIVAATVRELRRRYADRPDPEHLLGARFTFRRAMDPHLQGRAVPVGGAYVVLMWRSGATPAALMALSPATVITYLASVSPGPAGPSPAGWNVQVRAGVVAQPLTVPVEGRLPRGISIDVDLSAPAVGPHVLLLAFVGSTADEGPPLQPTMSTTANVPPTTITDLVTCWPYAAARVVNIVNRPTLS